MGYNRGAIFLHRKLLEWQWYQDGNVKAVFIHLLLTVNWKKSQWKSLVIDRSQTLTSYQKLSVQTGLSIKQVRTAIAKLKSSGEITAVRAHNGLFVSIVNYDSYQILEGTSRRQNGTEMAANGHVMNKEKKEKKGYRPDNISCDMERVFANGGWEEIPHSTATIFEGHSEDEIIRAFTKAVDKCGTNPPAGYVCAILNNDKKRKSDDGRWKRSGKGTKGVTRKNGRKSKFAGHPAASQGEG